MRRGWEVSTGVSTEENVTQRCASQIELAHEIVQQQISSLDDDCHNISS
jgi:hypothetical protein